MARVLHDGNHTDDLCADMRNDTSGDCTSTGGEMGTTTGETSTDCSGRHHRRQRGLIPVGNISVDCTPVSFKTPGQARNVVSCAVTQVLNVPVTRTTNVQVPTSFGCFECVPVTQTFQVPVATTVNLPPVLVPFPRLVCPPFATSPFATSPVATANLPATVTSDCGCHS